MPMNRRVSSTSSPPVEVHNNQLSRRKPKKKPGKWLNRTVWTINFATIGVAGASMFVYGAHNEWIQGAVNKSKSARAVAGRVVSEQAPSQQILSQTPDVSYKHYSGFASLDQLQQDAKLKTAEVLRGFIAMPATDSSAAIYLPVYEGTSGHVLAIGAGVGRQNRNMGSGNFPVFAHNMGDYMTANPSFFSPLETMNQSVVGHYVYTTNAKQIYTWQIATLDTRIPETSIQIMANTPDPMLTMVACQEDSAWWAHYRATGDTRAPYRIILKSKLVKSQRFNDAPQDVQNLFPDVEKDNVVAENVMKDGVTRTTPVSVTYIDNQVAQHVKLNFTNATVKTVESKGYELSGGYLLGLAALNIFNHWMKKRRN